MRVKEQDSSRLVIEPGLGDRVKGTALLAAVIGLLAVALIVGTREVMPNVGGIITLVGFAVYLLYVVGGLLSKKIVLDKLTEYITITDRFFMLVPRQNIIHFSGVNYVWVDETTEWYSGRYGGGSYKAWKVSVSTDEKAVKIDQSRNENEMLRLASKLREFIGLESGMRKPLRKAESASRIEVPSIEKSKASKGPKCANCGKPIIGLPFKLEGSGAEEYYCFRCKSKMTSWSRK